MRYFPVFLNLRGKKVVVVGGGSVAERKVRTLLKAGANIDVISPKITRGLEALKDTGRINHIKRTFRDADIGGSVLAIAATDSAEVNKRVAMVAPLVNTVDDPDNCSFIVPSMVCRGDLTIAISTSGNSPAFAKAVRKELQRIYGRQYAGFLNEMKVLRERAKREVRDRAQRERLFNRLICHDVLKALSDGRLQYAIRLLNRSYKDLVALTGKRL